MDPVKAYLLFTCLFTAGNAFVYATYVPFLRHELNLSQHEVLLLNGLFVGVCVFLEIITGMLADGRSRSWCLRAGVALYAVGELSYAHAVGFWSALLVEMLFGVGLSFLSGIQEAWLRNALYRQEQRRAPTLPDDLLNERADFRNRQAQADASWLQGLCTVLAALLGSFVGQFGLRLPYYVGALFVCMSLLVVWTRMNQDGEPVHRRHALEVLRDSLRALRHVPSLRWVNMVAIAFGGVVAFNHNWAPFFEGRGIVRENLGWIFSAIFLSFSVGALFTRWLKGQPGSEDPLLLGSLAAVGITLSCVGIPSGTWMSPLAMCVLFSMARGSFDPLLSSFPSRGSRATTAPPLCRFRPCSSVSVFYSCWPAVGPTCDTWPIPRFSLWSASAYTGSWSAAR